MAGLALLLGSCTDEPALSPTSTMMVEVAEEVSTTPVTTAPTTTTTATLPPPIEDLLFVPESFRERMVELVEETQALRGLSFTEPLPVEAITPQEMAQRLRAGVEADPRLSEFDQPLFKLLGLIGAETEWAAVLADFRGRATPGFYDVAGQKLWIVSTLAAPTPLEEMTLVGEIAKALVDRNLGMWRRQKRLARSGDSDYLTVLGGMAEADSTLVELLFMEGMTEEARGRVIEQAWGVASDDPALPSFLAHSLGFASGPALEYLQALFQSGGWDSVNEAHRAPRALLSTSWREVSVGWILFSSPSPEFPLPRHICKWPTRCGDSGDGRRCWSRHSRPSSQRSPPEGGEGTAIWFLATARRWPW